MPLIEIDNDDYIKFRCVADVQLDYMLSSDYNKIVVAFDTDFFYNFKRYLDGTENDNFTSLLIKLISKADTSNTKLLAKSYPKEVFFIWCYQNVNNFYYNI